jgi:hypothetical protein
LVYFPFPIGKWVAIVAAFYNKVHFFRRPPVAFPVATVIDTPQFTGLRMKVEPDRVAQTTGKNRPLPGGGIYFQYAGYFIITFLTVVT